ncbi:acetyl-CoA carboxylase biotin carboxyl carrier protein subunit, partial [Lacticaseibacillus rhamnosus]|nr:acetyl-CoA carboxylase biotin carboxyl carrier protein subunit [Lacticaseibacillus rhamnosus]
MLRKFKITIDGKTYLVEMEEIGGTPAAAAPTPAPAAAPTTAAETPAP